MILKGVFMTHKWRNVLLNKRNILRKADYMNHKLIIVSIITAMIFLYDIFVCFLNTMYLIYLIILSYVLKSLEIQVL